MPDARIRAWGRSLARALVLVAALTAIGSGAEAPEGVPRVRVVPIAGLDSLPLGPCEPGAWSPRGTRLALRGGLSQAWVLDLGAVTPAPQLAYESGSWIRSLSWSPDGEWLLLLFARPSPGDSDTLVAVPAAGGAADTLLAGQRAWPAVWAPDGTIHCRVGDEWRTLPPPRRWRPGATFQPRPPLVADVGPGLRVLLRPIGPGRSGERVMVGTYFRAGIAFKVMDTLPDGSLSLVGVVEDTLAAWRVVDRDGKTLLDLGRAGIRFQPTALSGDGRHLVGYAGDWRGEGYERTWLEAADASGRWRARVEGGEGGLEPQLSREDRFIAFLRHGATCVARFEVGER